MSVNPNFLISDCRQNGGRKVFMTQFFTIILMSVIVEGLITYAKTFFIGGKFQWQMLVGIILGVAVALVYNVDIFALLGVVAAVPYVGAILTGILISRGSNYIFDLIKALQGAGNNVTTEEAQDTTPITGTGNIPSAPPKGSTPIE